MVNKKDLPKIDFAKYPNLRIENPELHYEFLEEIGRGKMAVVKECKKKGTDKKYAAKIIKYDSDNFKFAIREYDFMNTKLKDRKGVVTMVDAFLVRKYLIIIMDLVEGKTLLDKVSSMMSLTEDDVAMLIKQLCEYLADWHSNNLVHLDLRPTNIKFITGRELKILDYNSCRHIANKKAGEVVDVIGDTEFCAPEMLNFEPVLPGSDMWTVGVLAYVMLSGISPFYYEDEDKVIASVQKVKWEFDEAAFEHVSVEAKDFIKKLFIRIPEQRLFAAAALQHKWLSKEYETARKSHPLKCHDKLKETDARLIEEEEEEYIFASTVLKTFNEDPYDSPESDEDDE